MRRTMILTLLILAAIPAAAEAHHYKPIQPGALLGDPCTMNFVFTDAEDALYIGAAGHCVPGVGRRAIAPEIGGFGSIVFSRHDSVNFTEPGNQSGPLLDFALIKIDEDKYDLVDPAVRYWGGPTGIETRYAPGSMTLHYGQGLFWQATEPSRPRYGVLQERYTSGPFTDWYLASHAIMGGDSGSSLLTGTGKALGIIDTVAVTFGNQPGVIGGPTVELILEELAREGIDVELVTTPFSSPTDPAATLARNTAMDEHCQAQTTSDPQRPDGCIRQQYYGYHVIDEQSNETRWNPYPWGVMANSDPTKCPEAPWYPTLLEHPCRTDILIVDISEDFWAERSGLVNITITWGSQGQDVDLFVFDSSGRTLGSSTNKTGNVEQVFLSEPPRGQYRIVSLPARYAETDFETLRDGDDSFRASAILTHEPRAESDDSVVEEAPPPRMPGFTLLALIGAAAVGILLRRRR